jgi:hypothetical protein
MCVIFCNLFVIYFGESQTPLFRKALNYLRYRLCEINLFVECNFGTPTKLLNLNLVGNLSYIVVKNGPERSNLYTI